MNNPAIELERAMGQMIVQALCNEPQTALALLRAQADAAPPRSQHAWNEGFLSYAEDYLLKHGAGSWINDDMQSLLRSRRQTRWQRIVSRSGPWPTMSAWIEHTTLCGAILAVLWGLHYVH